MCSLDLAKSDVRKHPHSPPPWKVFWFSNSQLPRISIPESVVNLRGLCQSLEPHPSQNFQWPSMGGVQIFSGGIQLYLCSNIEGKITDW